jgi:replicative DNA helicase
LGAELPEDLTVLCDNCHTLFTESVATARISPLAEAIMEAFERLDERAGGNDPHAVTGVPSGFIDLDHLTAGFQASELVAIASRPSVGKTAMALNIVRHLLVEKSLPIIFFSLELTRVELAERLLAAQARVDSHKLRKGHFSRDEIGKLQAAGDLLREAKLFVDDSPSQHLAHIVANATRLVKERGVRAVFIDSIDLIESSGARGFRPEQIAVIARRLKRLTREIKVPVIATVNLPRTAEDRQDHRPRLADLREAGSVEQHADTCLILHRPGRFDGALEDNVIEVIVAKQRNGPTGEVTLAYLKQFMRFENYVGEGEFKME